MNDPKCLQPKRMGLENSSIVSLQMGKTNTYECTRFDIKPSNGATPDFEIWAMWSTPSLTSLLRPLRPRVIAPYRALSIGQIFFDVIPKWWRQINSLFHIKLIELQQNCFAFKQNTNKWFMLSWIDRNRSVWSFNCVGTNDWCLIVFVSNT